MPIFFRRWAHVCAGAMVLLAGAVPVTGFAQAVAAEKTQNFNIAAGSLAAALNQLASESRVALVCPAELARGRRTQGVSGAYTLQAALSRLLEGTNLTYRFSDVSTVVIEEAPPKPSGARVLGRVQVEGVSRATSQGPNGSSDATATEGTGSYTSGALSVASRTAQSIKDTPQSVSVITQQRLQDQNLTDLTSAMNQATGLTLIQGATSVQTGFWSRGFQLNNIQIDGGAPLTRKFGDNVDVAYFPQIDLAQYDHVEVLRGANGTFDFYGDPSGTINLVRKRPLDHARVVLEAETGSWNRYRAVLDGTSPLGFDGRLRGRAVVSYQDNEYFYDVAKDNQTLVYGILEFDPTSTTVVSGGLSYMRKDSVPFYNGLPRYVNGGDLGLRRDFCLCWPWNRWDFDTTEVFARAEQKVGSDWNLKLNLTRNDQNSTQKVGLSSRAVNPASNAGPSMGGRMAGFGSRQWSADLTANGEWTMLGQTQQVVLGASYADQQGSSVGYDLLVPSTYTPYPGGPVGAPPVDVFHFNPYDALYGEPRSPLISSRTLAMGQQQTGAFINLRLTAFDKLHLVTGARYSRYDRKSSSVSVCTTTTGTCAGRKVGDEYDPRQRPWHDHDISWPPSVSLIFDVTRAVSTYVGYTDIYQSQASRLDRDLNPIAPITGSNVEAGVKWAGMGGRLNANLSLYRILQDGTGTLIGYVDNNGVDYRSSGGQLPDGIRTCCYDSSSVTKLLSEGADLELTGEVLPGWQMFTGYTWNTNRRTGGPNGIYDQVTNPIQSRQPAHLVKIWSSYTFQSGEWLRRLSVAGGINGQSKAYQAGDACATYGVTNPTTGVTPCLQTVPFNYTQAGYAILSARVAYNLGDKWNVALNGGNLTDKRYYQTMGTANSGNWYGEPRSFTLTVRGVF